MTDDHLITQLDAEAEDPDLRRQRLAEEAEQQTAIPVKTSPAAPPADTGALLRAVVERAVDRDDVFERRTADHARAYRGRDWVVIAIPRREAGEYVLRRRERRA